MTENQSIFPDFFKRVGNEIKETVLTKRAGCFVALAAVVLSVVEAIVYSVNYTNTDYYSVWAIVLPVLGAALFILLSLFRVSTPFAPAVLFAFDLAAFAVFVNAVYMYLSEVFYGGINAEAFAALAPEFVACTVMYIASTVIANVALYLNQNKAPQTANQGENL